MRSATAPAAAETRAESASSIGPSSRRAQRLLLAIILATSAGLQFYRLNDWQTFSDDQATQMNVLHGLLVDHHVPLLGLALSVGQAHMGPLFYYLLALPLWLGQLLVGFLDPTAGVALLGLFQVGTVYLIYRLGRLVAAPWLGLCAAGLYATSGLVVYWSRFLWPNCAPFFVVLALYALVALAQGRPRFVLLLAGSLAALAQLQPTAVLLIPVAAIWLLAVRPRLTLRQALLALGLVVLLFAPVIVYDLTHHLAELRAWLGYGTTVRPGTAPRNGLGRGVAALERFGWRAAGFQTRSVSDLLLALATAAVVVATSGVAGRSRALLARLLIVWTAVYLLAFSLYRGALHPHYVEPLYPLPFLAIGFLLDMVVVAPLRAMPRLLSGVPLDWPWLRPGLRLALYAGTGAVVIGLASANVRHLWRDHFSLDPFQLDSPAQIQGNRVTLGEMRETATTVVRSADHRPYSFLTAVGDGNGGGFAYLQQHTATPPAVTLRPLQYLLVEPAGRPPWLWPVATRRRWSASAGGFVQLSHVLLWRLQPPRMPSTGTVRWQRGADLGGATTAVVATPGQPAGIIAGYLGGPALSTNRGVTWRRAAWPALDNGAAVVGGFAWSPACPRRLYAATFDGVFQSSDGGVTWRRPSSQPSSPEVLALLAQPGRCGAVLAGTRDGIAHTDDGGAYWVSTRIGGRQQLAVQALANGDGRTVYAGTTDGVWISHDGGRSWPARRQRHEPRPALAILVDPPGARLLIAGTGAGLLYSGDDGATWGPRGHGPAGAAYALLAVDRRGTLLAGGDAGLYISHNDGGWWEPIPALQGLTVSGLARGAGAAVYAASSGGLYRSADSGVTWTRIVAR